MEFLWYDLETFGRDARRSRIAQFGALRTNERLEPIEAPIELYCQPSSDLLPSPEACLITGITPQIAHEKGLCEAEFSQRVHAEMSRPNTCVVGYNSLRFDDEFIRNLFYRNFFDPYGREWQNGNSRWDLIDPVRMACALRPYGIRWPTRDDGAPSFRLEELARANQLEHSHAHDALSDVEATLGLARLLMEKQEKLFHYTLDLRNKNRVRDLLRTEPMTPVLHVSSRYPALQGCAGLVLPLCPHPRFKNQIIVCDLADDPQDLIELSAADIRDRLYVAREDLPEGVRRIGLKQVHLNRSPILVDPHWVTSAQWQHFQIDPQRAQTHAERLRQAPGLIEKVQAVFEHASGFEAGRDSELMLYEGFPRPQDKALFEDVRAAAGERPAGGQFGFHDPRYETLAFRYRARNYPEQLDTAERERWHAYVAKRLAPESGLSELDFESYFERIRECRQEQPEPGPRQEILDALEAWGLELQRGLPPS